MRKHILCIGIFIVFFGLGGQIFAISPSSKVVALTFDDGPVPGLTEMLLSVLDQSKIRATFFVVGKQCVYYPDLVKKIDHAGHELANHSFSHLPMDELSLNQRALELSATQDLVKALTRKKMHYFRPPGGRFDSALLEMMGQQNLKFGAWTLNGADSEDGSGYHKGKSLTQLGLKIKNQDILLLHNGSLFTIRELPALITFLRDRGYHFVTLSQLDLIKKGKK